MAGQHTTDDSVLDIFADLVALHALDPVIEQRSTITTRLIHRIEDATPEDVSIALGMYHALETKTTEEEINACTSIRGEENPRTDRHL